MSLPRFFLETQILAEEVTEGFLLQLDADDLKHAKVLRLAPGEHIAVIDGASDYFECQVVALDADGLRVSICGHVDAAPRPHVTLFQGLAKGDKMETVIRHATELGVSEFVPVACKRSVMQLDARKADKKIARWQSIAKNAAMQSGQPAVPVVGEPLTVGQMAARLQDFDCVLIAWEEAPQTCGIRAALLGGPTDRVALFVGPEGGLASEEVEAILGAHPRAHLVSLGSSILRTETAGIVAPALVLYELGCLGQL